MGSISLPTLIAYGITLVLLLFIISAFKTPVRIIVKLSVNTALGLFALIMVNIFGNYISFHVPVNVYTVLSTGFLGVPGFILAIIITRIF